MASKWEILSHRRDELARQLEEAQRYLDGLERTQCGLNCGGCGTYLATEADFAKHFEIPDTRYLNLGNCPNNFYVTKRGAQ